MHRCTIDWNILKWFRFDTTRTPRAEFLAKNLLIDLKAKNSALEELAPVLSEDTFEVIARIYHEKGNYFLVTAKHEKTGVEFSFESGTPFTWFIVPFE